VQTPSIGNYILPPQFTASSCAVEAASKQRLGCATYRMPTRHDGVLQRTSMHLYGATASLKHAPEPPPAAASLSKLSPQQPNFGGTPHNFPYQKVGVGPAGLQNLHLNPHPSQSAKETKIHATSGPGKGPASSGVAARWHG
jgi:hypothetical protein